MVMKNTAQVYPGKQKSLLMSDVMQTSVEWKQRVEAQASV